MSNSPIHQSNPIITVYANSIVRNDLEPMLQREGLADLCAFEGHKKSEVIICCDGQEARFALPVRIGALLDQVQMLGESYQRQGLAKLDLGYGILNVNLAKFTPATQKKKDKDILLTEKEVEIIQYLYDNPKRKIPREELLEAVWGYARDTETHTPETHIYRLRRKIEPDPSSPVIIKKDEEGYYLGSVK